MRLTVPCPNTDCQDEEHAFEIVPEGQYFYGGPEEGEKLDCGYELSAGEAGLINEKLYERMIEHSIDEG